MNIKTKFSPGEKARVRITNEIVLIDAINIGLATGVQYSILFWVQGVRQICFVHESELDVVDIIPSDKPFIPRIHGNQ